MMNNSVASYDFHIGDTAIGEKVNRMCIDREIEMVIIPFFIGEDVFFGLFRQREEIAAHVGVVFIEGTRRSRAVCEKDEVFGEIEKSAATEGDEKYGEKRDAGTCLRADRFLQNPECRYGSHQKNRYLCPDRAKCVWKAFSCKEFGDKHGEERAEQKEIEYEARVSIMIADTPADECDGLPESEEESSEKKSPDKRIKNRIRRIIVTPILITEKIVFDKRKRNCSCERSEYISMIYLR